MCSGLTPKHLTKLEKLARDKQSSLSGPFVSCEKNVVNTAPEMHKMAKTSLQTGLNLDLLY